MTMPNQAGDPGRERGRPPPSTPETLAPEDEAEPSFNEVFSGEIPVAERAWRRSGGEGEDRAERPPDGEADPLLWALRTLPTALREIRQEVRRAADLAADALATAASVTGSGAVVHAGGRSPAVDRLPDVLAQLRDEVRHAGARATDALVATRQAMDALPSFLSGIREELETSLAAIRTEVTTASQRVDAVMTTANQDAARAFSVVAREVRGLGDRQSVLREEVKLLGRRLDELERQRRRQQTRTGGRVRPTPELPPASPSP